MLVSLAMAVGCDDDPAPKGVTISIVVPFHGGQVDFADDTNSEQEGLNFDVLVYATGLNEGDAVILTGGPEQADEAFYTNPVIFRDYNLGTAAGQVTLTARSGSYESDPVTVTLTNPCPTVQITNPEDGAALQTEDDRSTDNGFQLDVQAGTNALAGTEAYLLIDGGRAQTANVSGPTLNFYGVTIGDGEHTLELRINGAPESCSTPSVTVTVDTDAPACSITDPTANVLNQSEDDGDAEGMQVDIVATSDAAAGITVTLYVDGQPTGSPAAADATTGEAQFSEVALAEGTRLVHAVCEDSSGNQGFSATREFTVDTGGPNVTILSPVANAQLSHEHDALPDVDLLQIEVLVATTAADAEGQTVTAAMSGSDPLPVYGEATIEGGEATLYVQPAGGGEWTIEVALSDANGNETTAQVTIFVDIDDPRVQIRAPVAGAQLNMDDDLNPDEGDLQYTVIACASEDGTAQLRSDSAPVATGVVTAATCTTNGGEELAYTVTFEAATLVQGTQTLTVDFTDRANNSMTSLPVSIEVDTEPPLCLVTIPGCDTTVSTLDMPLTISMRMTDPGTVVITDSSDVEHYNRDVTPSSGYFFIRNLTLAEETYQVQCQATDSFGNTLISDPCTINVSVQYSLRITRPSDGEVLGEADDQDGGDDFAARFCVASSHLPLGTALSVTVDDTEALTPTFDASTTCFDVPLTSGEHTVEVAAEVDGVTTSDSVTVTVDIGPPEAVSGLSATILDRRASSLEATWTAPADEDIGGFDVRWSHGPIVTDADFEAAHQVPWEDGSVDANAEVTFELDNLLIERNYYVAVRTVDLAENEGDFVATETPLRPTFETLATEAGATSASHLSWLSDVGDLNGDDVDDLVAGSVDQAYILFGPLPEGEDPWEADTVISMSGGWALTVGVGDFNNDGEADLAVGAPLDGGGTGAVFLYYGGPDRVWRRTMNDSHADVAITGAIAGGQFGRTVSAAGDFCGNASGGDGYMDLAVSAPVAFPSGGTAAGAVYVICGADLTPGTTTRVDSGDLTVLRIDGTDNTVGTPSFGLAMSELGDLNGDGRDDLAFSNYLQDDGTVYAIRGLRTSAINSISPITVANSRVLRLDAPGSAGSDSGFGYEIAGVGDINRDGAPDLAVGAPFADGYTGRVYFYLSDGGWFDTSPARLNPDTTFYYLGGGIARAAGVGGAEDRHLGLGGGSRARSDVLMAMAYDGAFGPGQVAIMLGQKLNVAAGGTLDVSDIADNGATPEPEDGLGIFVDSIAESASSYYVSYIGDVTDDGYEDFVVADFDYEDGAGQLIVYY
jgi:hypothetical protein